MAEPLIPYIKLPELPLSFLAAIPAGAVGAIVGGLIGALLGGGLSSQAKSRAAQLGLSAVAMAAGALIGAFIAQGNAPLFDPRDPPSIKPFGTLVALGVYLGSVVAVRHARQRRLDERKMNEFILWILVGGFVSAHVLDAIFYHPQKVLAEPLYLLKLWDGLSSFGGFVGALSGALAWRFYRGERILKYCEVVNSAFPLAWVFGRAGCASVHDHPGRLSDAWLAVRWPDGGGTVGRFDLGLIEFALTIPLAVAFAILWRRRPERPLGFYTGVMCVAYAPVRFALDFLREAERTIAGGDPRYGGLTPAQWACFGLLALGLYFLRMAARGSRPAPDPRPSEA